jgi:nitrite reductase/ring-hydroxylating ferredoxin subunit/uncharacterized membrane protein
MIQELSSQIEAQTWLKPAEDSLKKGLDKLFEKDTKRGKPVENALHGVWLGHPLHPVLTDLPIGAWCVAFVLDVAGLCGETKKFQPGADAAVNIGIAGALAAAAAGITDWKEISLEARKTGMVHGLLNSAALACYIASSLQRSKNNRTAAVISAGVGLAIIAASSWLGGHLVYASQIGVERTPGAKPPEDFTDVAKLSDLQESKPFKADCAGYPIVLVRQGSRVYALSEVCTHLGGPLSEGTVEGDCIRCPWHGSTFELETGEIQESPAVRPRVSFEVRVVDDQIAARVRRPVPTFCG